LASLYKAWVPSDRIITISNWSSELAKLAANAMLAQRISSINSLSVLCEAVGADVYDVGRVIGLDQRIGPHMLQPSIGFGGSCFEKDIRCLAYLANSLGLGNIARYWSAILSMNDFQKSRQVERIIDLAKSFALRRVAILGFAFKEHTGDIRGTPALAIVKDFVERGFAVRIFDPLATRENILGLLNQEISFLDNSRSVTISSSATEACKEVEAIVIATAWDEFRTSSKSSLIDWHDIACGMQEPRVLFDGCNVINAKFLRSLGINVIELGRRQSIL
jgi:UDPglucose 6-dehydrogenase